MRFDNFQWPVPSLFFLKIFLTVKICDPDEIKKSEDLDEKICAVPDLKVLDEKPLNDWDQVFELCLSKNPTKNILVWYMILKMLLEQELIEDTWYWFLKPFLQGVYSAKQVKFSFCTPCKLIKETSLNECTVPGDREVLA